MLFGGVIKGLDIPLLDPLSRNDDGRVDVDKDEGIVLSRFNSEHLFPGNLGFPRLADFNQGIRLDPQRVLTKQAFTILKGVHVSDPAARIPLHEKRRTKAP